MDLEPIANPIHTSTTKSVFGSATLGKKILSDGSPIEQHDWKSNSIVKQIGDMI